MQLFKEYGILEYVILVDFIRLLFDHITEQRLLIVLYNIISTLASYNSSPCEI